MNEMLIAEELCVLRMCELLDGAVWGSVATGIIGAAVAELVLSGRANVSRRGGEAAESYQLVEGRHRRQTRKPQRQTRKPQPRSINSRIRLRWSPSSHRHQDDHRRS